MKKIINAIIVSVCMLCVTGCSMLIAGNNKADVKESYKEDLTANVADGNTAQEPFKVSNIQLENGYYYLLYTIWAFRLLFHTFYISLPNFLVYHCLLEHIYWYGYFYL